MKGVPLDIKASLSRKQACHVIGVTVSGEASAATGVGGLRDDNSAKDAGAVYLY